MNLFYIISLKQTEISRTAQFSEKATEYCHCFFPLKWKSKRKASSKLVFPSTILRLSISSTPVFLFFPPPPVTYPSLRTISPKSFIASFIASSSMATMPNEEKVRCTYSSCGLFFNSSDEMQSHKASADQHHYCSKHDMDFPSAVLLHLHKIMSQEHFACPECELELRSDSGLQYHMKMVSCQAVRHIYHTV